MPCQQITNTGVDYNPPLATRSGPFTSEADCLNACKEGACCESNGTCNVRPQCQCQGAGQTFQGIGTVCSPNPCFTCCSTPNQTRPSAVVVEITGYTPTAPSNQGQPSIPIVGTYILPPSFANPTTQNECFFYKDSFFPNPTICGTLANSCFGGCAFKLTLTVSMRTSFFGGPFLPGQGEIHLGFCDSQFLFPPSSTGSVGSIAWGFLSNWPTAACSRQQLTGTSTQTNNPNFGLYIFNFSYAISYI